MLYTYLKNIVLMIYANEKCKSETEIKRDGCSKKMRKH